MAMRMEGSLNGVIYRKALSAPVTASKRTSDHDSTSAHNVIVLDVPSVARFFTTMTDIIMVPVYCYWVYTLLSQTTAQGPALIGLFTLLVTMGVCCVIELINAYLKVPLLTARDRRIARTEEVLTQARELTQLGVADMAAKEVKIERDAELRVRAWRMYLHCITWALSDSIRLILQVAVLGSFYVYVRSSPGATLTAASAISVLQVTSKFVAPLSKVSHTAHIWFESMVSVSRCSRHIFGLSEEECPQLSTMNAVNHRNSQYLVFAESALFKIGNDRHLEIQSLKLERGQVAFVVGSAGGGKSSTLLGLSGELPLQFGKCYARWTPALSQRAVDIATEKRQHSPKALGLLRQNPWLNDGTVRSQITFCREHDENRLSTVLTACGLDFDIAQWPEGRDRKIIQGGGNVSGGQRVRMALCRAIYAYPIPEVEIPAGSFHGCVDPNTRMQGCDVFLLDSPFEGLDHKLAITIFRNLFSTTGLLRNAASVVTVDESLLNLFLAATNPKDLGVEIKLYDAERCRVRERPTFDWAAVPASPLADTKRHTTVPEQPQQKGTEEVHSDQLEVNSRTIMNMYDTVLHRRTFVHYLAHLGFKRSVFVFCLAAAQMMALQGSNWMAALWSASNAPVVHNVQPVPEPPAPFADGVAHARQVRDVLPAETTLLADRVANRRRARKQRKRNLYEKKTTQRTARRSSRKSSREGQTTLNPMNETLTNETLRVKVPEGNSSLKDDAPMAFIAVNSVLDYAEQGGGVMGSQEEAPDLPAEVKSPIPLKSSIGQFVEEPAENPQQEDTGFVLFFVTVSAAALTLCCAVTLIITGLIVGSCRRIHEELMSLVLNASFWVVDQLGVGVLMTHFNADIHKHDIGPMYDLMGFYSRSVTFSITLMSLGMLSSWMLPLLPIVGVPLYFCAFRYYQPATRCFVSAKLNCYPPLFGGLTDVNLTAVETRCAGVAEVAYEIHENHIRALMRSDFAIMGNNSWALCRLQLITTPVTAFCYSIPLLKPYLPIDAALVHWLVPNDSRWTAGMTGLGIDMGCRVPGGLVDIMVAKNQLSNQFISIQRIQDIMRLIEKVNKEQRSYFVPPRTPELSSGRVVAELTGLTCSYLRVTKPAMTRKRPTAVGFDDVQVSLQKPTIRDITGLLVPGEVIGVAGRSGAGKSSLLLALSNRMARYSGTFRIAHRDVAHHSQEYLHSLLAYLPQHPAIMGGWTVRYILDPEGVLPEGLLWGVLHTLQLYTIVHNAPDKLDAVVSDESWNEVRTVTARARKGRNAVVESYSRRSSGAESRASLLEKKTVSRLMTDSQMRLLWLGRLALRGHYKVVLIDEPPHKQKEDECFDIVQLVKELFQDSAIVLVAHHADVLRMCDKVWMMHNSRLVRIVNAEEIRDESTLSEMLPALTS